MAENAEPGKAGQRPSKILLILVGAMAVLLAAGGVFIFVMYSKRAASVEASEPTRKKEAEVKSTLNLEPFLVNLADTDAVRFVKASFRIGLEGEKEGEELGKNPVFTAAVRDSIISLLTSKSSSQVLTPEGKSELRKEILTRINDLMHEGKAREVYIVEFVVQM
jgi:flagellar protein FliL